MCNASDFEIMQSVKGVLKVEKANSVAKMYIDGAVAVLTQNAHFESDIDIAIKHLTEAQRVMKWGKWRE